MAFNVVCLTMRVERHDDLVVKVAESRPDRRRLEQEAAVLSAVAHPGVVRLVAVDDSEDPDGPGRLSLQRVAGPSLAEIGPQPETLIAGWGAALATVLADLHDLGYVHGDVRPEHILIDGQGRPVLCGFGSARRLPAGEARTAMEADVRALADLVRDRLPPVASRPRRWLAGGWLAGGGGGWLAGAGGWLAGGGGGFRHRTDARGLARSLIEQVPGARTGPPEPPSDVPAGPVAEISDGAERGRQATPWPIRDGRGTQVVPGARTRHRRAGMLAVAAAATLAVGAAVLVQTATGSHRAGSVSAQDLTLPYYVLRSTAGEHPVAVVGRWGCGPARAAVLDTASGAVWAFPAWPGQGETVAGRLVRRVGGATGLEVVSSRPGCDRLLVLRTGRPDLTLDVGPTS
jgi:tRNA A-37 threonylcarbamoyl transferase component Bud32